MKNLIYLFILIWSCSNTQSPSLYYNKGKEAFENDSFEIALNFISKALALDDSNIEYYKTRLLCYYNLDKFDSIKLDAQKILSIDSSNHKAYYFLAFGQNIFHEYKQALANINKAISYDSVSKYLFLKGQILLSLGDSIGSAEDMIHCFYKLKQDDAFDYMIYDNFEKNNYLEITRKIGYCRYLGLNYRVQIDDTSKKNGYLLCYFTDSQLYLKAPISNGDINGEELTFYNNGKLRVRANYLNGKLQGEYNSYFRSGHLKMEKRYEKGIIIGKSVDYYQNGNIKNIANYKNGILNGYNKWFFENGETDIIFLFKDGEIIEMIENDTMEKKN